MTAAGRSLDVARAPVAVVGVKAGATLGEPTESDFTIHAELGVDIGVWECTPGVWPSSKVGVGELMVFTAGRGVIVGADGTRHEIRPGIAVYLPDGWSGYWEVEETVRKVYAIVASSARRG